MSSKQEYLRLWQISPVHSIVHLEEIVFYIYSVTSYSRMDQQLSEIVVATHSYCLSFFQNLLTVNDAPFQINASCLLSAPS